MRIKSGLFTIAAAAAVVSLSGCGASGTAPAPQAAGTATHMSSSPSAATHAVMITISNFMYSVPASVAPGAKVTVKNQDGQNHTVTSTMHGAFDVKVTADGGTATFTAPSTPGRYTFGCTFHANMMGTLVVT
jgi:plastocyanin